MQTHVKIYPIPPKSSSKSSLVALLSPNVRPDHENTDLKGLDGIMMGPFVGTDFSKYWEITKKTLKIRFQENLNVFDVILH